MSSYSKAKNKKKIDKPDWLTIPIYLSDYEELLHNSVLGRFGMYQENPEDYYRKLYDYAYDEQFIRLNKLFSVYNIPEESPKKWMLLASFLAEEAFTGLRIEAIRTKKGKKTFWNTETYRTLYEQYKQQQKDFPEKSDEEICCTLSCESPWKEMNINKKALQNELAMAKSKTKGMLGFLVAGLPDN